MPCNYSDDIYFLYLKYSDLKEIFLVKMARSQTISCEAVARALREAGPFGMTPETLAAHFQGVSRSTLGRRLTELINQDLIKAFGQGRSIRYVAASSFGIEDIRRYFAEDWQLRPAASFQEVLLQPTPGIDRVKAERLTHLQAMARQLDRKFLADFLIDFSWASSLLEGSTYSNIDTQALLEYGERNRDKPLEDAVLILNHKTAIQHLWSHRDLTAKNLNTLHAFLTDSHGLADVEDSDHFLPKAQQGVPREYQEVRLGRSAYNPPFRPATGYVAQALDEILATAKQLHPLQAAFYLITRIPYVQVYANGNKRTSRLAANLPLLEAGLLPISFVDFKKSDYVLGMAAFYELGDIQILAHVFIEGYLRSIIRSSEIPSSLRLGGFKIHEATEAMLRYVNTGIPLEKPYQFFLKG